MERYKPIQQLMADGEFSKALDHLVRILQKNPDDAKALQYLQKAAGLGLPEAMYDLGIRYEKGQGVLFNLKTALQWIQKAAEAGHDQAKRYQKRLNQ